MHNEHTNEGIDPLALSVGDELTLQVDLLGPDEQPIDGFRTGDVVSIAENDKPGSQVVVYAKDGAKVRIGGGQTIKYGEIPAKVAL